MPEPDLPLFRRDQVSLDVCFFVLAYHVSPIADSSGHVHDILVGALIKSANYILGKQS